MLHRIAIKFTLGALFVTSIYGRAQAQADFTTADWLIHRGWNSRSGGNGDPGLPATSKLGLSWTYPPTALIPAEVVVDNTTLPPPGANATRQQFAVNQSWNYPAPADRTGGAWPPGAPPTAPEKLGDYVWANSVHSNVLAGIGVNTLANLPNMGTSAVAALEYKAINAELDHSADSTIPYAKWVMGLKYPPGTTQGSVDVSNQPIAANQRYAAYIRFPYSGTTVGGVVRPNVQHVMIRVSWGIDDTDPLTSRIFMMDTSNKPGEWARIRTGAGDDRYFPFDGTYPIRVTLYTRTPDDVQVTGEQPSIVVADAVRFVPEAMRGDIHGPAASAKFPYTSLAANRKKQRTYFGRDETVGPKWIKAIDPLNPPTLETGFTQTLFDPTKAPEPNPANANYNPVISDVTASVRTAVFYCIEDNFGNNTLGKMLWRYPTKRVQTGTTTVDDLSGAPYYSATNLGQAGGWQVNSNIVDQVYGSDYNTINASSANASQVATFQAPLPNAAPNATYSVFAWIPAPLDNTIHLANRAQYTVYTDQGPVQFSYNQDQAIALGRDPNDPLNTLHRTGGWRRIASNIHFPAGVFNGSNVSALGKITVQPDSTGGDDNVDMVMHISDRIVVSDAIQFVAESSQSNSVVAAPLITNVTWPSGILRQMVYFATTDGHVWALDAEGQGNDTALTQAYWVYPSISDPDPAHLDLLGSGKFDSVDDPNVNPDTANNVVAQGIDGDVVKTTVPDPAHPGSTISTYTVANAAPALDSFVSSPMLIQVRTGTVGMYTYKPYIVVGNQNGRIYALDPVGRTTALGEPFPLVFASGDTPGIPGTTRRNMTWPTIARDKWLRKGGLASGKMTAYTDDPAKSYFNASIAANVADGDFTFTADRLFAPAGDGHIYCVDLQTFKSKERISNPDLANAKNDGAPKWQYPSTKTKLDAMTYPGAFNAATKRYVFTAGGRIYAVDDFNTTANGVAKLAFVYPGTSAPPANPLPTDKAALQSNFTGPILMKGTPLNGGNLVAYATTQDGKVYAFDATVSGGAEPPVIFAGTPIASTRSNPVYLKSMLPSAAYVSTYGPHILFGTDAGALLAFHAGTGVMDWAFYDGFIGGVPIQITDSMNAAQTVPVNTSNVYRTADIATANGWLFQGTEGIQETGEMGGQMRAYADKATYGGATDGEPPFNPDLRAVETRLVDLFNAQADDPTNMMDPTLVWERFRDFNAMTAKSPYNERVANHQKTSTQGSVSIYEWGDSIYVAAWGTYLGNFPPTVIFTKSGSGNTVTQQIQAINDIAYAGPALTMIDPATNMPVTENVYPWRASVRFDLETGSEIDPQTPGSQYIISALALIQNGADAGAPSFALRAGQFQPMVAGGDLPRPPRLIAGSRVVTIANPLALTSRGLPGSAGDPNTTGWTSGFPVNNSTTPVTEILGNGNLRAQLTGTGIAPLNYKDLVAPMGLINHGNSGAYNAVDNNGKVVPALLLSDRSNVYKRGRHINNVRVAKNEMRWGWNPADNTNLFRQQTGNVMNPLPWEQFPNTVPNVSQDYPDIDRSRATFKVNGVDMSVQGIRLEWPTIAGGVKTLQPTNVDMQLDVPAYTAANVNTNYFDINGGLNTVNNSYGLLYPISTVSGADVSGNANLRGLISPSAGYTGTFLFFMASSPDGNYHGSQARDYTQTASTLIAGREDTFRQLHVSVGVPPDMTMRVEEETVDIGAVPHGFGYIPGTDFAPSYTGGPGTLRGGGPTYFDLSSTNTCFLPVTISNKGNVNLVNVRMSKIAGDYNSNPANPNYWIKMQSDQVDPLTGNFVWGPRYNFLNPSFGQYGAAGNIGIVSSLDAPNFSGTKWEYYFWPYNMLSPGGRAVVDYVTTNFPGSNARMPNWVAGQRPTPSIHKPRPSTGPQTMSIPDVAFGDPLNVLGQIAAIDTAEGRPARDTRPKVSVAIPLTQPAGTYTTTITPFEDHTPEQWRNWVQFYRNFVSSGSGSPFTDAPQYGDNDGILNFTPANPAFTDGRMMAEGKADPGFRLKAQVIEARLTNGNITTTLTMVEDRSGRPAFGAYVQPAIFRNPNTGLVTMYWSSNRPNRYGAAPQSPDVPWYLNYSSLNPVLGTDPVYGPVYDWKVAFNTYPYQWWNPVPFYASQYPDAGNLANIFPSQLSDLGSAPANTGLVAGTIINESVRHSSPAIAQDDDPTKSNAPVWLFWQGNATKTTSAGGQSQRLDTRTLYTQLNTDGTPASPIPFSILNDPSLPKFNTKPLIMTHQNGKTYYFLFWNGGADGRSRIYFNYNVGNPLNVGTNPNNWSVDTLLPTPGALEWQSNPSATHRVIWTAAITGNLQKVDVIDVTYTGTFGIRRQPETLLTRYAVLPKGNSITLQVIPLPQADNETAMRDGSTNVWSTKDITYVYRDSVNKNYSYVDPVDGLTKPFIQVFVYNSAGVSASTYPGGAAAPINGYNAGTNSFNGPTFDNATGRLYFSSTLGGQVVIDPQSGTVNFQGVSPKLSDRVVVRYIPQTMRLNVTRTDSNAEAAPAGWANDPGFISKSSVAPTGANTQALSFIDRMQNPHRDTILPALAAGAPAPPVARLWTVYRKSSNNNSGATIYYKTMRLMARLPRGVLRDYDPATNTYSIASNITISGNLGPVEVDWVRGRLYFTEIDEGSEVKVTFNYSRDSGGNKLTVPTTVYRVAWGDEISTAVTPGDQTTNEVALPINGAVNEGMVSAFKDPYQDKVWIVWSSTRKGTTDLYYLTLAPQFYTQPAF